MHPSRPSQHFPWHWLPVALVLALGLLGSYGLWRYQSTLTKELVRERFEAKVANVTAALQQQVELQVDLLSGLRNLMSVEPHLSRRDFEWALGQLDVMRTHPSVEHIDFVRQVPAQERAGFEELALGQPHLSGRPPLGFKVHPAQTLPEYFVVDFTWPVSGNEARLGLELHSQPVALEAYSRARRTGQLAASAPFMQHGAVGVTLNLPVFDHTQDLSMEQGFIGTIGLTVNVPRLLEILRRNSETDGLSLELSDRGLVAASQPSEPRSMAAITQTPWDAASGREIDLPVGGRRWQLRFMPEPQLLSEVERYRPATAAGAGVLITLLLAALVAVLALRRLHALQDADAALARQQSSENRFQAVFNQASVGIVQLHPETGKVLRANRYFCDLLGYSQAQLQQMRFSDYTVADDMQLSWDAFSQLVNQQTEGSRLEKRYRRKDGGVVWVDISATLMKAAGDETASHLVIAQDISARKRMELELARSEERYRDIFNHMPVGVAHVDQGQILYLNDRHVQICGYSMNDVADIDEWWRCVVPDEQERERARAAWQAARDAAQFEVDGTIRPVNFVLTAKGGTRREVELSGMAADTGHIVVLVDESQRKRAEQEIAYLARTDVLTGLVNRRVLLERLQQAVERAERSGQYGAVLMLGIDRFKTINETFGHEVGDRLLALVARRLSGRVPAQDTVARHGGDVFVVVLGDLAGSAEEAALAVQNLADRLLEAVAEPYKIGQGRPLQASLSVGVARFGREAVTAEELLKRSDMAMYAAKAAGRGLLRFFDPAMQVAVAERVQLESDMRSGIEAGQFELYYQPKVQQGRIIGAEALVRWNHPERGLVSPLQFVPLAEESGLILPLGEWVMKSACEQLARWSTHPVLGHLSVSVNVSALQFRQPEFAQQVLATLATTGAPTRLLKFELTESMLIGDIEATITKMGQLRGYGVRFSLDDFGTGYSSLSYLKRLPLDEIKIDQSFVRHVLTDPNEAAIARTIIALGASLDLEVIAEGVETEEQRVFLERNGCDMWQGYLLSKPVSLAAFEALVHARTPAPGAEP
ncbi:bifunctional diguanylate cyclase/phosphodiesterase [Comamonas flocculans]|uniref:EAL domain-containing protein n=1 Tax=Comamonas flocculans TaxID=2597701 RepID=A0A5B8RX60_9BURK|nr:EAL domain-containing protein [Comamonas flocculans]QEA14151.1 EAL domain-containing protein [Comamonas flocculans]